MASKRKNSLVNNINRRKRAGKSRPKSRSTVSKQSYERMQEGWPGSKRKSAKKTAAKQQGSARRGASRKRKSAKKK